MNTTIQLKLKRLQSLRADEPGVLTSLRRLSEFHEPSLSPHEDRRMLRGAIERRSLAINDDFLKVFDGLSERLRSVEADVSAVSGNLGEMVSRLNSVKSSSRVLLEHVVHARKTIRANDERRATIAAFLERFQLSEADKAVLNRAPRPAGIVGAGSATDAAAEVEATLVVMDRLADLSARTLELLRSGQQAVGLELREEMARWEEKGQRALFLWLSTQTQGLDGGGDDGAAAAAGGTGGGGGADGVASAKEAGSTFWRALRMLSRCRPLYAACVRELASARGLLVADAFQRALTIGGPGSAGEAAKPMEVLTAEPAQFVSAMLSWVHGAALAERSRLRALCELQQARPEGSLPAEGARAGVAEGEDGAVALHEALSLALERTSRLLELRLSAVVETAGPSPSSAGRAVGAGASIGSLGAVLSLSLTVASYARRLELLLLPPARTGVDAGEHAAPPPPPPALVAALLRCAVRAEAAADALFGGALQRLQQFPPAVPPDLSCPQALLDFLSGALLALQATEASHGSHAERMARANAVCDRALDALSQAVEAIATDRSRAVSALADLERLVFRLNCVSAMAAALAARATSATSPGAESGGADALGACATACARQVAGLRTEASRLCDLLADESTSALFAKCGLAQKLAALNTAREQPGLQLATIPGLEPPAMAALLRNLYALLFRASAGGAGSSLTPECERVADVTLRELVTRRVSRNTSLAHRALHEAVSEPRNGYTDAGLVLHPTARVDSLLDCDQ